MNTENARAKKKNTDPAEHLNKGLKTRNLPEPVGQSKITINLDVL